MGSCCPVSRGWRDIATCRIGAASSLSVPCWISMPIWEYKVFASHLDPAELVVLLDESGRQGWELVTLVAVADELPLNVLEPATVNQALDTDEVREVVPVQSFRYIFKRPLLAL